MALNENMLYEQLLEEICKRDVPKYDSLVIFVQNFLTKHVEAWCRSDSVLRNYSEDIMQEILLRIIKNCEKHFFKSSQDCENKTCEEFKAWCYKVAKNYFFTFCKREKKHRGYEPEPGKEPGSGPKPDPTLDDEQAEINECFSIVMDLKSSPHIILTWLTLSILILINNLSKIESTHFIVKTFSNITLFDMFDIVLQSCKRIDWMKLDGEQILKQRAKLEKHHPESGKIIGEMKYGDFYMSKGPEMSISDWVNRINSQIKSRK